jgi:hypothetical protein
LDVSISNYVFIPLVQCVSVIRPDDHVLASRKTGKLVALSIEPVVNGFCDPSLSFQRKSFADYAVITLLWIPRRNRQATLC